MIRAGRAPLPPLPTSNPADGGQHDVDIPRPRRESPSGPDRLDRRGSATSVLLNPYLTFADGAAREALELYASVLGGEPSIITFGDMGTEGPLAQRVMHGQLETPGGLVLMGADGPPEMVQVPFGDSVSVSLSGGPEDADRLRGWFATLSEGGDVRQPLEAVPWGDEFGMFVDRFGISWLVNIARQSAS